MPGVWLFRYGRTYRGGNTADFLATYNPDFHHILLLSRYTLDCTDILVDRHDMEVSRTVFHVRSFLSIATKYNTLPPGNM